MTTRTEGQPKGDALHALIEKFRSQATESREEAGRIRRTVKACTDAESNCFVRAEVWDKDADELEAALPAHDAAIRSEALAMAAERMKEALEAAMIGGIYKGPYGDDLLGDGRKVPHPAEPQPKGDALHALLNEIKSRAEYATKPTAITGSVRAELSAFIDKLEDAIPAHDAAIRREALAMAAKHFQVFRKFEDDPDWIKERWVCSCGQAKADGVRKYEVIWREHILSLAPNPARLKL